MNELIETGLEKETETDESRIIKYLERKTDEQRKTIQKLEEVLRRKKLDRKRIEREYDEKIENYLSRTKEFEKEVETLRRDLSKVVEQSARKDETIYELTADLNKARKIMGSLFTDKLHELVIEQKEELRSGQIQPILFGTEDELFEFFKKNDDLKQVYEEFKGYLPLTDEEFDEKKDEFKGRVFQDIAYNYFVDMQSQFSILLSSERTLEFYKKLHRDKPVIKHSFGLDSIEGVSVPDGMQVVEEHGDIRIAKIYECTLEKDKSYFEKKYEGFLQEREYLQQLFGDYFQQLFGDTRLCFVVPKRDGNDRVRNSNELPCTRTQFEDFVKGIYYRYKQTEDDKTFFDIQKKRI